MVIVDDLLTLFTDSYSPLHSFENWQTFEMRVEAKSALIPNEQSVLNQVGRLRDGDRLSFIVTFEGGEPVSLYTPNPQIGGFLRELNTAVSQKDDDDRVSISVSIHKPKVDHAVSIYSLRTFSEYLTGLPLLELLTEFRNAHAPNGLVQFLLLDGSERFYTKSIHFAEAATLTPIQKKEIASHRTQRFMSINTVCHYGNSGEFDFIPDDFKLIVKSAQFAALNSIFNRLCFIQSIVSLYDITNLQEDSIKYKLNGYKAITGELLLQQAPLASLEEYYQIYLWVYEGGNLSDKIGLARNIISLHLASESSVQLTGSPHASIKSSFEIYLKQNIKQYIEVRNKISDQLVDFNKRANEIVDKFAANFQKSIFAFVSFFTSVLVLRVLSIRSFSNIMTAEATTLSLGFLGVALVFLIFSRWEITHQRERFTTSYRNMKRRFTDLLTVADIQKILRDDTDYLEDFNFIKKKQRKYTLMWIITLVIFLIVILVLSYLSKPEATNS